jgi:MraZ protein
MDVKGPPKFLGNYSPVMDDKGRLTLPSPLREELFRSSILPERLYLSFFPANRCLKLYTFEMFQRESDIWSQEDRYPNAKVKASAERLFFSNIETLSVDKAGRILINANYREKVGLGLCEPVIVNGAGAKIELWAPAEFKANELSDLEIWEGARRLEESIYAKSEAKSFRLPEC